MFQLTSFLNNIGFWISWLLIPLIYEFIPAIYSVFVLFIASRKLSYNRQPSRLPQISLIIPVYNSADTLFRCIRSVADSTYPSNLITIIIANNGKRDSSFHEYRRAHRTFKNLLLQWIDTSKGKSRALNSAIYRAKGKYIIHIDSDGILQENAIMSIVKSFENDKTIDAQTGTILTQQDLIKHTNNHFLRFLQLNEFFEYAQSFLAGRAIESEEDHLFTMSGAFSAFRREKLVQTKLYNIQTVGEDIDMTFQIRYQLKGKVVLCPEAIYYVEPISGLGELYTQRQRWQRGELEAIHYFMDNKQLKISQFFNNYIVRRLIMDHTILFLRIIWMTAIFVMIPLGYSLPLVIESLMLLYFIYVFICVINYLSIQHYLKRFNKDRKFYLRHSYILLSLPFYYLVCSFIQFTGIVNAMTEPASWTVKGFDEERHEIQTIMQRDLKRARDKHD